MKRFFSTGTATALALCVAMAPALAQQYPPGPPPHPVVTVKHTTTVQHTTVVKRVPEQAQHPEYNHGPVAHPQAVVIERPPVPHQQTYVAHPQPAYAGHSWHNGDRYTGNREAADWTRYRGASRPPAGYEWVHDGGQLVLISIASGVVANVLLNAAYQ